MKARSSEKHRKIAVVGAGTVGSTYCYALAQSGLADEIALIDKNVDLARGQLLDLIHGQPFFPTVSIHVGDVSDYANAQIIVIAAGTAQRPGEKRLQLLQRNADIVKSVIRDITEQNATGVIIVVTNPVDVLTYVALKWSGWERGRVVGSGTVLDSARLRHLLSDHCQLDIHNVHAYILGEHGDSEFAAWSMAHIGGMPIDKYCIICGKCIDWEVQKCQFEQEVRDSAYHIISYKGATCYAIGLALVRISEAILRNQNSVLTVSTFLDGEFGLQDVCLSVPCIVSENGVQRIIESPLSEQELAALSASASVLNEAIEQLNIKA